MVMLLVALHELLFQRWALKRVTRTDTFRQKPLLGLWPATSPSLFPRNRLRLLTNEASVGYFGFCSCYTLYALSSIYGFHQSLGSTWSLVFIHIVCSRRSGLLSAGYRCPEDTGGLYTVVRCSYHSSEITKLATNSFIRYAELTYCLRNTTHVNVTNPVDSDSVTALLTSSVLPN